MQDMRNLLSARGADIIAESIRSHSPQDAASIAATYLSSDYGGGQGTGGAGDTVLKRTIKLLAHALIP
jgi:hypothetical protein